MHLKKTTCASLTIVLLALLAQADSFYTERVLNPKGWNLPEVKKMALEKVETITLPGSPEKVVVEYWACGTNSTYRITNLSPWRPNPSAPDILYSERVGRLTIYKTTSERILCFRYARILEDRAEGLPIGGLTTLISDLDEDGKYEFQMGNGYDAADRKLLISLLRIKLGLSEEADLLQRIVGSALRALDNKKDARM